MKKEFRRTYLHLADIVSHLSYYLETVKNKEIFLSAFSSFFLLEKPFFDHTAQEYNSIQTFYANHYLREALKLDKLPSSKELYGYSGSEAFANDIVGVSKLVGTYKNEHISQFICNEVSPGTLVSSVGLENVITFFVEKVSVQSCKLLKYNKLQPSDEVFSSIASQGYYIEHNLIDEINVKKLKKILTIIANEEATNGVGYFFGQEANSQRIYNLVSKHPVFQELICNPYIVNVLDKVFRRPTLHEKFVMNSLTGHIVVPGAASLPLHIDSVVPDPIPQTMVRFIAILALDDFTNDNGATELVPGSHKFLRRPSISDVLKVVEEGSGVKAVCKAGSLILFDGTIWHRSTSNTSSKSRVGVMLSYAASYFLEVGGEEEHLSIIPKEVLDNFSPKMKQMVGYQRAIKKGAQHINKQTFNIDINNF